VSASSNATAASNASVNPSSINPSSHRVIAVQQEARTAGTSGGSSEVRTQRPELSREMSTDSVKSTSVKTPKETGKEGEKSDATKKTSEKAKHSVAIQNCLKRLADAKDGKRDLKMLLLCDVKLSDADINALTPAVKTSTSLRSLSLYGSGITASAAKVLAEALASHEFLTMLDLGCNALGAKGVEDVTTALLHNSTLLNLGMGSTDMQDAGATAMSHVLRMNCSLTEVYLNSNNITEVGAQELAGALVFNDSSRLSKLFLFGNPLGEAGINEMVKLRNDSPYAQERVPMSEQMALMFMMGTHERLGASSAVLRLRDLVTSPFASKPRVLPLDSKAKNSATGDKRARVLRANAVLKIIKLCCTFRNVERTISGDGIPIPEPKETGR